MTRVLARSFIGAIALAALSSLGRAEFVMGPTLAPGQTLRGRFIQVRHLVGLTSTLTSNGSFLLAPGRGLIWRLEQPIQTTTVITPASLRQIIDGREVQQLETARAPFVAYFYDLLDSALSGDWAAMRHDFAVETRGDRRAWRTVLTPRRTSDAIAEVVASIVITGGKMVDVVNIKRANGDSEQLTFLEQTISSLAPGSDDARLLDDNKDLKPRG